MYEDLMKPDEDWTNLSDSAERRRIQNRIAQRVYRRNMRERTNEVQRLKARIRELEGTREGASFDAFLDDLPSRSLNTQETFGPGAELSNQELYVSEDKCANHSSISWTRPDQSTIAVVQSSSAKSATQSLDTQTDLPDLAGRRPTLEIPRSPKPQISHAPQKRPLPAPGTRSDMDHLQDKGDTSILLAPYSPSQSAQFPLRAGENLTTFPENGQFLTGGPVQDLVPPQPMATGIQVTDDTSPRVEFSRKCFNAAAASQATSPSISSLKADESGPIPPRLCGNASLIHLAVASGNADTLRLLVQAYGMPITKRDAAGYTPLERAVLCGRPDLVAILMEHGMDISIDEEVFKTDRVGQT